MKPPQNARTFSVTAFGKYTPRGFHPGLVNSVISGISVQFWGQKWVQNNPGAVVEWSDAEGKTIAREVIRA